MHLITITLFLSSSAHTARSNFLNLACVSSRYSDHNVEVAQGGMYSPSLETSHWEFPPRFCMTTGPFGGSSTEPSGVHSQLAVESTVELEFDRWNHRTFSPDHIISSGAFNHRSMQRFLSSVYIVRCSPDRPVSSSASFRPFPTPSVYIVRCSPDDITGPSDDATGPSGAC